MAPRSPNVANTSGTLPVPGQPARAARRSRVAWLRALPLLARPVTQTMPWGTLLTGCLAGLVYLAVTAHFAGAAQPLGQGNVRLASLPAVAALAFVVRGPFRPLTQVTPVPAWIAPVGRLLLATPVLAVTCWAQLRLTASTVPPHILGHPPAVYPVIAQLSGWCAVTVTAATCVDRSRYADLGGAIAGPASFAAIALAWYVPAIGRFLATPPATPDGATIAWYAVAATAVALACVAMRDQWHRYARRLHPLAYSLRAYPGS
jgi:hypothetical protein